MGAYFRFWKNFLSFKGTTNRRDFWVSGILFNFIGLPINLTEALILTLKYDVPAEQAVKGPIFTVYCCVGLIALISMSVRRLRDGGYLNKSAWKFLIPFVGFMRLAWCLFKEESATEDNCV